MITSLELKENSETLTKFSINPLPQLMVVAGSNGSGKTALLNLLNSLNSSSPARVLSVPRKGLLQGKLKYVPVGYVPGDIGANSNSARVDAEYRSRRFVDYVRNGVWTNSLFNEIALGILQKIDPSIQKLDSSASAVSKRLTERDIYDVIPSDISLMTEDYKNNEFIAEVCLTYLDRQNTIKLEFFNKGEIKSEEEVEAKIGKSPWSRINELFEKYDFHYRLSAPQLGITYNPRFHKDNNPASLIEFSKLSSGEKVLVTMVLWAFNAHQTNHHKVLLLDEFDAHLNPALAKMMMEVIADTLVRDHGLQVILTTHSPSTVAFTPPGSLFWMERDRPIRAASNHEVIPRLSDGFFAVHKDTALGFIGLVVEQSPKTILCVEGKTDKKILETAWAKLFTDESMPFSIHDVFDCHFLTNMFLRGDIFTNYPNRKFLGLLDFDAAFSVAKEKGKKQNWEIRKLTSPHQVFFEIPGKKGTLLTLPVPEFRKNYARYDIANSYLSIELLFEDNVIGDFCDEQAVAGGASLLKFKDKKKEAFAEKVASFDAYQFSSFVPLFNRLNELCNTSQ